MKLKIIKSLIIILTVIFVGCILPAAPDDTDDGTGGGSSAPEISITTESGALPHNSTIDFGSVALGSSVTKVFTITNSGSAELSLTGDTKVLVSGTDTGMFTVSSQPTSPIAVGGTSVFVITYAPTGSEGAKSASIIILNSDSDEGSYTINLTGTTPIAPTGSADAIIGVEESGTAIIDGMFDFGGNEVGSTVIKTFTITNTGTGVLGITGTPSVAEGDSSMFTVSAPVSQTVAIGSTTTFTVTYNPTGDAGVKTTALTITNSDGTNSSFIINLSDTATLVATKFMVVVDDGVSSIDNFGSVNLTVSRVNVHDIMVPGNSESVFITADLGFNFNPASIEINAEGTGTDTFIVSKSPLWDNADIVITADNSNWDPGTDNLSIVAVLEGDPLSIGDLSSGLTLSSFGGDKHLAPRDSLITPIPVGGDITIAEGRTLVIYPGVTLDMSSGSNIIVNGTLKIYGTLENRVKISTTDSSWGGISSGNASGDASIIIDGAYIEKAASTIVYLGISSSLKAGDTSITNSTLVVPDGQTSEVIEVFNTASNAVYTFDNNVLVAGTENAIYFAGSSALKVTTSIQNNTIYGRASGSPHIAITISSGLTSDSVFTIYNNIISGDFSDALWVSNSIITPKYRYNVINVNGQYINTSNANLQNEFNLFIDSDGYSPDSNFGVTWIDSEIFSSVATNDYRLVPSGEAPDLTAANGWESMVGSLSNDHANQKGAYGNEGYAPFTSD